MGLYARHIFPRLCDWSMRTPRIERLRSETLTEVDGEILEIGFGTGVHVERFLLDRTLRIVGSMYRGVAVR